MASIKNVGLTAVESKGKGKGKRENGKGEEKKWRGKKEEMTAPGRLIFWVGHCWVVAGNVFGDVVARRVSTTDVCCVVAYSDVRRTTSTYVTVTELCTHIRSCVCEHTNGGKLKFRPRCLPRPDLPACPLHSNAALRGRGRDC